MLMVGGGSFGQNPTISVTEFYVTAFDRLVWNSPAESVVSDLYPGKIIGFHIMIWDRDAGYAGLKSIHNLPGEGLGEGATGHPCSRHSTMEVDCSDAFAPGLLLAAGGEIPEISAIESITWGRIKAAFVK